MTALSRTALAFLLTTLITAPAVSARPSHSAPEIGPAGSNWWQNTTPAMTRRDSCHYAASPTATPEAGPLAWNWWQQQNGRPDGLSRPFPYTCLSSETGHVPWDWWQHPDTHGGMSSDNAC